MKKFCIILFFFTLFTLRLSAAVSITAATNGSNLCSGVYNTLGNIVITEGTATDIALSQTGVTLILTAPPGYEFKPSTGSVSFAASADITAASIAVSTSAITVTFTTNGMPSATDQLTVSGIQVTASIPSPPAAAGNILRTSASPGTASIAGITNDVTNFGTLSQSTAMIFVSSTATQNNTSGVATNTTNNEIIGIQIVTCGTTSPLSATSFTLNTSGTDNPAVDITNAKVWTTGTSSAFATTTQFGSAVASPNGTFTITGTQTLFEGTNYFWLTYDVPSGATNGNNIDAQCTSLIVGGSTKTLSVTDPAGVRGIGNMTYLSSTCVQITSLIGGDATNNEILQMQVVTKGGLSPLSATSFTVNGNGTTSTVTDKIQNAKIFYTGNSSTFASTTQVGSTFAAPGASNFNITGSQTLATGTNYFWLSFDTKVYGAPNIVVGDLIDGECSSVTIGGTPRTPTVTVPAGNRIVGYKWIGVTSTDWLTTTNWATGLVPTSTTDVYIPSGTPFQPLINNTANCRDLFITSGATLTVSTPTSPAKYFSISGRNITNNGTIMRTGKNIQITGDNMLHLLGGNGVWISGDSTTIDLDCNQGTTTLTSNQRIVSLSFTDTMDIGSFTLELYSYSTVTPAPFKGGTGTVYCSGGCGIVDMDYHNLIDTVPAGYFVQVTSAAHIRGNLTLRGGGWTKINSPLTVDGDIIIDTGHQLNGLSGSSQIINIGGNLINDATFTSDVSTVTFNGAAAQTIGGANQTTFNNLTINNTSSTGVTLNVTGATKGAIVTGALALTDGYLYTSSTNTLTLNNAATSSSGSSASFVKGPMKKYGNQAFVFPVGDIVGGTPYWRRIGITAPTATTDAFNVQYFHSGFGTYALSAPLNNVSNIEYWNLNRTAGTSTPQVTLYWEDAAGSGINDCGTTDLRIAYYDIAGSALWKDNNDVVTTTGTCTGATAGTIQTTAVVTAFGPFTFGSKSSGVNPLGSCTATITLGSNTVSAQNICAATMKVPVQSFSLAVAGGCDGNLTDVGFTTTGTYAAADVTKFQLWYNSSNNLSSATQLGTDITTSLGAGAHSFSSLNPALTSGITYFFWLTTNVAVSPTNNNTIACNAIATTDLTSTSTKAGSTTAGGTQTLKVTPTPTITAGGPTTFCAGGSVTLTSSIASSYSWTGGATTQSISATTSGNYFVTVTDGNGCTGVSAATTVTVNNCITTSTLVESGTLNSIITDASGGGACGTAATTNFILNLPSSNATLAKVCINITHAKDQDLAISLADPGGAQVALSTNNGGTSADYTNTCFFMSAPASITTGAAPFTGDFIPQGNFSTFNPANSNGNWTLKVTDDCKGTQGTMVSWSMTFSKISPTTLCKGGNVTVNYTINGTYNAGNVFTAQLSNAAGSFATPVNIGNVSSTTNTAINATIPVGTSAGTGYRIRVISSDPPVTGTDNAADITVPATCNFYWVGGAGSWDDAAHWSTTSGGAGGQGNTHLN